VRCAQRAVALGGGGQRGEGRDGGGGRWWGVCLHTIKGAAATRSVGGQDCHPQWRTCRLVGSVEWGGHTQAPPFDPPLLQQKR